MRLDVGLKSYSQTQYTVQDNVHCTENRERNEADVPNVAETNA